MSAVTDLISQIEVSNIVTPRALTTVAVTSDTLDTGVGNSVSFVVSSSGLSQAATIQILVVESDSTDFPGDFTTVPPERFIPVGSEIALTSQTPENITFGVTQTKRYLKVLIDASVATANAVSVIAIMGSISHIE